MKRLLCALLIGASAVPAQSAVFHYTLQDVVLNDGGTASGFFELNYDQQADTVSLVDFDITSTTGSAMAGRNYTLANTASPFGGAVFVYSYLPDFSGFWQLAASGGDFLQGGTINLSSIYEFEANGSAARYVSSGSVTTLAADVPEPAMLGLFGLGALGLGLARRRKA